MIKVKDIDVLRNNFDERRKKIISECDNILVGKNNIISDYVKINDSNWQGAKLEYALILVGVNEIQYCREIEKIWDSWLELILEINEYVRMNVNQRTLAKQYLFESLKEFLSMADLLCHGFPDECFEIPIRLDPIFGRCVNKISEALSWVREG